MPISVFSEQSDAVASQSASSSRPTLSCKWCKKRNDSPNPYEHERGTKPFLLWRRPKGRECGICPWFISADADLSKVKEDGPL